VAPQNEIEQRPKARVSVFHPQPCHLQNGWHVAVSKAPQNVLIILDVSDELASFYTNCQVSLALQMRKENR
jgi:hypothetical protein